MGILLAIGLVSWGAYVGWSEDRARESDIQKWASTFDLYKSRFFVYPVMPTSSASSGAAVVCLGAVNSFPTAAGASTGANKCGQYKSSATSSFTTATAALTTEVSKVGDMPKNAHQDGGRTIYEKTLVGPIAYVTRTADSGTVTVTAKFLNFFKGDCPTANGFVLSTNIAADFPRLSTVRPGSGTGSTAKVCYLQKSFVYDL